MVADGEENRCDRSKPRKHPNAVGVPGALVFYRISRHEYQIGGSLCCRLCKVVYYSPVRIADQCRAYRFGTAGACAAPAFSASCFAVSAARAAVSGQTVFGYGKGSFLHLYAAPFFCMYFITFCGLLQEPVSRVCPAVCCAVALRFIRGYRPSGICRAPTYRLCNVTAMHTLYEKRISAMHSVYHCDSVAAEFVHCR